MCSVMPMAAAYLHRIPKHVDQSIVERVGAQVAQRSQEALGVGLEPDEALVPPLERRERLEVVLAAPGRLTAQREP